MIMRKLKVIQLACYRGNIGDNANIVGTRSVLNQNFSFEIEYTDMDILDFLWGVKKYDNKFIELVNQHDLLIIGGGGYLELTSDTSSTGTPLDISEDVLRRIKPPIVYYALGVDIARGINTERLSKFKKFLDYLLSSKRILVSVRNDGSMASLKKLLGDQYAGRVHKAPDGGFFTVVKDFNHLELPDSKRVIGINLAGDMLSFRFPANRYSKFNVLKSLLKNCKRDGYCNIKEIGSELFLEKFSALMNNYLRKNDDLNLVLIPHIFKDIGIIGRFISKLDVCFSRRRVTVAPYIQGNAAQEYVFDIYRKCDIVMGMRFHANVCCIGLTVPTIGFVSHSQIEHLYQELNLSDRAIKINQEGFEKKLSLLIDSSFLNKNSIKKQYKEVRDNCLKEVTSFHKTMENWLNSLL